MFVQWTVLLRQKKMAFQGQVKDSWFVTFQVKLAVLGGLPHKPKHPNVDYISHLPVVSPSYPHSNYYVEVSWKRGTPVLIHLWHFPLENHPSWGTTIYRTPQSTQWFRAKRRGTKPTRTNEGRCRSPRLCGFFDGDEKDDFWVWC